MATLSTPTAAVHASFLTAMVELQAEGRGVTTDGTAIGHEIRAFGGSWASPTKFHGYVQWLIDQAQEDAPRPEGFVPVTNLWLTDGAGYLGRIAIRHRLTEHLLQVGGHIGYDVRPSARRRGHATRMLREALPVARELGITSALLTCDLDNVASRKVIESNGGVLEDQRGTKYRFWVPTA
jgi:predicted acetyltransferase